MQIPFLSLAACHGKIKAEVLQCFERIYDANSFVLGETVQAFESEYAVYTGTKYSVGVGNGLEALQLALQVLGVKKGDEVIVPANTYIATLLAISHTGATPVLVEPCPTAWNLDPTQIEEKITNKTKVILPVHLYGQACEMEAIKTIAQKHGLYVVEDNAQAQGATYKGVKTGAWGDVNATSFYPTKNLGALGDGGAITTHNETWHQQLLQMRNYGAVEKNRNNCIGYNSRLDELQAGVLQIKLQHLDTWNSERLQLASWYNHYLDPNISRQQVAKEASHVYHLFVIRSENRDLLRQYLASQGIETAIHYPIPPHLQQAYDFLGFKKGDFPITETLADTCLSLPLFIGMTETQVKIVAEAVNYFYKHKA